MATRARILADYVSSGVTAAEFDFLDTTSGTPGSGTFLRGDKTWQGAGFGSGTKMIFNQTAAPTGWTKITGSGNDTALRVTTGTVGTGGSVAFETAFASHTGAAHTLSTAEMPAHIHDVSRGVSGSGECFERKYGPVGTIPTSSTGGGGSHTHGSIDLNVSFVDVIIATKD